MYVDFVENKVTQSDRPLSGIVSQLSWKNPETKKALKNLFNVKDNELLVGVSVDRTGIKAHIKTK